MDGTKLNAARSAPQQADLSPNGASNEGDYQTADSEA